MISLVATAHNRSEDISSLAEQLDRALEGYDYELILVAEDGTDGSTKIAESLSHKYPIKVICCDGKGGSALVAGLNQARGEVIGVIEADLQHSAEKIPQLLKALEDGADIAIASRYIPGGGIEDWSRKRRVISRGIRMLALLLLPSIRKVKDPTSGLFMIRREVIDGIELNSTSHKILPEVLTRGRANVICEVPYTGEERAWGETSVKFEDQVGYLKRFPSLVMRGRETRRLIKFCIVGASGVIINEGLLWLLHDVAGILLYPSSAIAIEASVVNNFTWHELWTFRDRRGGSMLTRIWKFHLVSISGLLINMGVLAALTEFAGIHHLISNLAGIALALAWRFSMNTLWTWRKTEPDTSSCP